MARSRGLGLGAVMPVMTGREEVPGKRTACVRWAGVKGQKQLVTNGRSILGGTEEVTREKAKRQCGPSWSGPDQDPDNQGEVTVGFRP